MFAVGNNVVLLLHFVTFAHVTLLSISLIVNATLFNAVSSFVLWLLTSLIVGASFTAFTVSTNVSCALKLPSLIVNVTVLVPFWLAAGCILTVQFCVAHPPIVMFAVGNNVVLLLHFVTLAQVTLLSTSLIVNATLFNAVSSFVL